MSDKVDSQSPLSRISIASPCQESWEKMTGSEQVRHCDRCALSVYNLSAMTTDEAETLVQENEGRLCVHYFQRHDGTILTQDCPVGLAEKTMRKFQSLAASLLAGLGFLSSCTSEELTGKIAPQTTGVMIEDDSDCETTTHQDLSGDKVQMLGRVIIPEPIVEMPSNKKRDPDNNSEATNPGK